MENNTLFNFDDDIAGFYVSNLKGQIENCNEAFCHILGFSSKEDAYKHSFLDKYPSPTEREKFLELLRENKKLLNYEQKYLKSSGEEVWVLENSVGIFDKKGDLERIKGYLLDITQNKKLRAELKKEQNKLKQKEDLLNKSESRYKLLFQSMHNGFALHEIVLDKNGKPIDYIFKEVNPSFEKLTGLKKNDILEKRALEILPGLEDHWIEKYGKVSLTGEPIEFSNTSNALNKTYKVIAYSPKKNYFATSFFDVTEIIEKEKQLLKLQTAIEQSANIVLITDTEGNIEYTNRVFSRITGYSPEEVLGKNPRIFNSGNRSREFYESLWATISSGEVWRGTFRNKQKNGGYYWDSSVIAPVKNKNGKIINYIAIKEDVTEKMQLENDLILAKEKAEESDKLKTAFLTNMSHEIRTPMNAIIGFSDVLEKKNASPEQRKLYTGILKKSSYDLLNVINNILDIAKIETGQTEIYFSEFQPYALIKEVYDFYKLKQSILNKEEIQFELNIDNNLKELSINSDRPKIKQILSNLLDNSFKFISKGYIELNAKLNNIDNCIELIIRDSGIGISKDKQKYIFNKFRQADETISRRYGGSGLGLSLTKEFVELLGGEIKLNSVESEGTTIIFTIPFAPIQDVELEEVIHLSISEVSNNKKIMIVEDVHENYELIKEYLSETGLEFIHCEYGLEAIEAFKQNEGIDLILMDIRLPDISGYEVTRIIKRINPDIPIVAQTAYALEEDKEKVFDAGCDEYIAKPIQEEALIRILEKYLK